MKMDEKMKALAQKAEQIKKDPKLRHKPNAHDLWKSENNAKQLLCSECCCIAEEDKE